MACAHRVEVIGLEVLHLVDRQVVQVSVRHRPDRDDLLLHRIRRVLLLLEHLDHTRAAVKLRLTRFVQFGTELGERLEFAELSQVES